MSQFFINKNQITDEKIVLQGNDVNHIKNVLRKKVNDEITVSDGENYNYNCKIEEILDSSILLAIIEKKSIEIKDDVKIDLFQALPKFEKMELIIQKCTELGINDIYPIETKRIIVKLDEKGKAKKQERWQKIAEAASKQCLRGRVPKVCNICSIKNVIENLEKYDIVLVAYEKEKANSLKMELQNNKKASNIAIVIGPEGGFDESDLEIFDKCSKVKYVTLGNNILRTETAGLVTLAMINYEYS